MYDIIIIGAGVIGCSIARALSKYDQKVLLLDKEGDVSNGASKANSGIVHGGYDAKHGTMKAKFSRAGNQMFKQLNEELNFGFRVCGSLVLAFSEEDLVTLEKLKENGQANGVNDLEILDQEGIRKLERYVSDEVIGGLYCPSVGVTSPYEMTIALAENAVQNGVQIQLDTKVLDIEKTEYFKIFTSKGQYEGKVVINAAGVYADKVANMLGLDDFYIIPRRGEYVLLNKDQGYMANHVLFQCPTEKGKGILVTQTYHGNLMLGPNAQEVDDPEQVSTNKEVLDYIVETARKSVPNFDIRKTLTSFSGIRATSDKHDFIIEESKVKGFVNVAGIESPGLTSSPAIAEYVVKLLVEMGLNLNEKTDFNPYRKAIIKVKTDDFVGMVESDDPEHHIICRCEQVTEAEIIDALKRGIDVNSIDSIKRRTRAGMGPCQGRFCGIRVAEVIAKTKGISIADVPKRGKGSSILPPREDRQFWLK